MRPTRGFSRLGQGSMRERWNAILDFLLKYKQHIEGGQAPEPPAVGRKRQAGQLEKWCVVGYRLLWVVCAQRIERSKRISSTKYCVTQREDYEKNNNSELG
jgi:hypothetical protein